jgi:hypothetical protein
MSTITFKALINDIHFDPKKGTLKIQLIAANYVSLDKLATLGPQDENVKVTLESAQTKINELAPGPAEGDLTTSDVIDMDEKCAESLKKAAERLRDNPDADGDSEEEGKIITEFPTPEASGEGEK